ncbi:LytR/AlgR family response regulator transcription factor [Dyadobacter frigoris]|uniref:Response regulator transcription factor n=1 Tax=Dyadobacter frigoris TaxID=2576211 RepID=A0A4U6D898_9BACT|nr:LytTR family DNA-binding domain-containing protein [Dyadobacter frigoris]TKT92795.1 response regulator transcription factor [Dyadobacter frigoris]GLU54496.1 DNA-binding response regulator [Dyadobacter frigoris]
MNVLIIEDETLSATRLENLILRYDPSVNVLARIPSVKESILWLENDSNAEPDLIFLDIMLEDGLGFKIIEQLNLTIPILFTTAYNEYALKAFKANSVDYLLKPVNPAELDTALNKFKDLHFKNKTFPDLSELKSWLQLPIQHEQYKDRFMASAGTRLFSVKTADIAYFTIEQKATYLRTFDGKHLTMDYSLDKLIQLLDPSQFFRINRSLIISLGSISSINALSAGRLKLELAPTAQQEIYVSTDRIPDFKQWLGK